MEGGGTGRCHVMLGWCPDGGPKADVKLHLKGLNEAARRQPGRWLRRTAPCDSPSIPRWEPTCPVFPKLPGDIFVSYLSSLLGAAASCLIPSLIAQFLTLFFGYMKTYWFSSTITACLVSLLLILFNYKVLKRPLGSWCNPSKPLAGSRLEVFSLGTC